MMINSKSKRIIRNVIFIFVILIVICLFLLYGPFSFFRDAIITSAMTTKSHHYLAKLFYSDDIIYKVLDENKIVEIGEFSDPKSIDINGNIEVNSKYEKQILDHGDKLYKLIRIRGKGYRGYLVAIYEPSKVKLAVSSELGKNGEFITKVAHDNNVVVAINASGFYDPENNGTGGIPHGTVIKDGKVISEFEDAPFGGGFIGFTNENKLLLGKMTSEEAISVYRDAVEFGPFLIVNGKASFIKGNGGWGIAPRTAIGQRQDGIVLFLVIDGRTVTSIGANMVDLTQIMMSYGAYNAANLDGGSSTELLIDGEIINVPVSNEMKGLRKMPTFWVVKE